MNFFELKPSDISNLSDADLREMVARLCEAELHDQKIQRSCILWGGAQEAADGGLDIRVKSEISLLNPGFVPRKNTGFQIKKSSMGKAACREEMLMRGEVKEVIRSLIEQQGAYIIVSGKDDCSDKMLTDRIKGMQSAIENITSKEQIFLDFYGRDRLSAWLRQYPSVSLWVRSKLGGQSVSGWFPYQRWAGTPKEMDDEFLMDEHPCVTDLNSRHKKPMSIASGINLVREKLGKSGAVIRLIGFSGVGKTRFAQALFEENVGENPLPKTNVIYVDLGNEPTPSVLNLVTYLKTNDCTCYVVLDNCPPEIHRTIQKEVSHRAKLSILTIEYDISDDQPEETEVIHIEPSSIRIISKLVLKRFPVLGRVNADKVAEFSGGNARLAIALASRVEADETLTNFSDEELFRRIFNQRKGKSEGLLESAEILSLVYSFNIYSNEYNDELSVLSQIGGSDLKKLYRDRAELFRRQLVQQRGEWLAILPHALANRLARRALQNIHPDQINAELLKANNRRLFKSCAHRLGYLHDFEPAQTLASSWLKDYQPFHDITQCNEEELAILEYIAPIFPDKVLTLIENASINLDFYLRNHPHLKIIVRLLRKLAYEVQYFTRAANLIFYFAKTEISEENYKSIVSQLAGFFYLYYSGTQAKPQRRYAFLNKILASDNIRELEIAEVIFYSAFEIRSRSSIEIFDFGARTRDFGWMPKTDKEHSDWYNGFINLLEPLLDSDNDAKVRLAKSILENSFIHLWEQACCHDILENIVKKYGVGGKWLAIYVAIRITINRKRKEDVPEVLTRLKKLECLTAPANFYSEMELYLFTKTLFWNVNEEIFQRIEKLTEFIVAEPEYLKRLAPKLWQKNTYGVSIFGKELAKGASDQKSTFDTLIHLMRQQKLKEVQPCFINGFIAGVYETNPKLSRKLQESVLYIPELKPHFLSILIATPISPWGIQKLIKLTKKGELAAFQFHPLYDPQVIAAISDEDLFELLIAMNDIKDGIFVTIKILEIRAFANNVKNYKLCNRLRSVGRESFFKLLLMDLNFTQCLKFYSHGAALIKECFSESATKDEIRYIINLICDRVEKNGITPFDKSSAIACLLEGHAEYVLDRVLLNSQNFEILTYLLFDQVKTIEEVSPLNLLSIERVLKWCNGDQNRIQKVARLVSPYIWLNKKSRLPEKSKELTLSPHIKALLDEAEDKAAMVETIFYNTLPNCWSGSLANILEERSQAFAELLKHPSCEVKKNVRDKLIELGEKITYERELEAKRNSQREQKFE